MSRKTRLILAGGSCLVLSVGFSFASAYISHTYNRLEVWWIDPLFFWCLITSVVSGIFSLLSFVSAVTD
jgi:hypothetical protein